MGAIGRAAKRLGIRSKKGKEKDIRRSSSQSNRPSDSSGRLRNSKQEYDRYEKVESASTDSGTNSENIRLKERIISLEVENRRLKEQIAEMQEDDHFGNVSQPDLTTYSSRSSASRSSRAASSLSASRRYNSVTINTSNSRSNDNNSDETEEPILFRKWLRTDSHHRFVIGKGAGIDRASRVILANPANHRIRPSDIRMKRSMSNAQQQSSVGDTQAVVLAGLLAKVPILAEFNSYERLALAHCFEVKRYKCGDLLIRKNEIGDTFFVLVQGTVGVYINTPFDTPKHTRPQQQHNNNNNNNNKASWPDNVSERPNHPIKIHHTNTLPTPPPVRPKLGSPLRRNCTEGEVTAFSSNISEIVEKPQTVTSEPSMSLNMAEMEKCERGSTPLNNGEDLLSLYPGDHFGESVLLRGAAQTASVVARSSHVSCLTLSRRAFNTMVARFDNTAIANTRAFARYSRSNGHVTARVRDAIAAAKNKTQYMEAVAKLEGCRVVLDSSSTPTSSSAGQDKMKDKRTSNRNSSRGGLAKTGLAKGGFTSPKPNQAWEAQDDQLDYQQVIKDVMREPLMVVNGERFLVADGGNAEYSRFLERLTDEVISLVNALDVQVEESEASQLVVEVLKKCTRTTSGGDAYMQCVLLMNNPRLILLTPEVDDMGMGVDATPIDITLDASTKTITLKTYHRFRINYVGDMMMMMMRGEEEGQRIRTASSAGSIGSMGTEGNGDPHAWAVVNSLLEETITLHSMNQGVPSLIVSGHRRQGSSNSNASGGRLHNIYHMGERVLSIPSIDPVQIASEDRELQVSS